MKKNTYDFSGWATRNNIKCADGRTIMKDAFKVNDGQTVPLVWMHQHNDPTNVLGHALLENREEGVYAYCSFNSTDSGENAKLLVNHGDVSSLSIYANKLQQEGGNVLHGTIREVSLVLAGANPGAYIDSVIEHSADDVVYLQDDECVFSAHDDHIVIEHSDSSDKKEEQKEEQKEEKKEEEPKMANESKEKEKTVEDVFNELTEEQKNVVYAIIGQAVEDAKNGGDDEKDEGEDEEMKHNVFDTDERDDEDVISHSDMMAIIADGKRYGSLKESALQHGITDIDYLFPEAKELNNPPEFIKRDDDWVSVVMAGVHHTPFSRVKSSFANLTADEARAKGYIKGHQKAEEIISLLKRSTTPQTVYKKQKLDRDDVIDITDFDVVAWLKREMRMMLDEELARAFLVGDGRLSSSDDKIDESHIRPIALDADLFTIKANITNSGTPAQKAKALIQGIIRSYKNYKGSGAPTLFIKEDWLTEMLLLEDTTGRLLYDSQEKLKNVLRVSKIVPVPVFENVTGARGGEFVGLIVNLKDYNVGADKGGAVSMFDDFDIDYNAQKYLIETRCSGAMVRPYAAIAVELNGASQSTDNDGDVYPKANANTNTGADDND